MKLGVPAALGPRHLAGPGHKQRLLYDSFESRRCPPGGRTGFRVLQGLMTAIAKWSIILEPMDLR
jgi:hypothetical protein